MGSNFIGRQPIVNERGALFAYDLLSSGNSHEHATALLVNSLHSVFGSDRILGKRAGLIRVDRQFILRGMVNLLPKEKVIYALIEESEVDDEMCGRLRELREQGYRFALNDCAYNVENIEKFSPLFPYLEFLKIDMLRSGRIKREDVQRLQNEGLVLIGSKIESHDMHAECLAKGFTYFEGFFISKPRILENPSFSVEHEAVIGLWNMLQCDVSIEDLVKAFERNHMISLKLLRFVNSAAFSLRNPVSSIRHVLTLLGREPLGRWLMLLLFSEAQHSDHNTIPLLLMVVNRTELMTRLLELIVPSASKEQKATAYFVGMLSLIHLLFNMPHREVLRKLNTTPEIERACFEGDGFYGELLSMVRSIEMADEEGMAEFMERHALRDEILLPIIAEAMDNVNRFDEAMG